MDVSIILLRPRQPNQVPPMQIQYKGAWRYVDEASNVELETIQQEVKDAVAEVMDAVKAGHAFSWVSFKGRCKNLYDRVVPKDAQKILSEASQSGEPVLCINNEARYDWIPWEIMHDGQEYLGLKFQIARLPLVDPKLDLHEPTDFDLRNGSFHSVHSVHSVLGQEVVDDPSVPASLWESTFQGLAPAGVVSCKPAVIGAGAAWPSKLDIEAIQCDILHITCHTIEYANNRRVWALKRTFTASENQKNYYIDPAWVRGLDLEGGKPLVFGNACVSIGDGAAGLWPGLGRAFLLSGAQSFVGSFAPLTTTLALDFAHQFYKHLLQDGLSIGKALLATKKHYHQKPNRKDACYLFYCLYGPPTRCFTLA